MRPNLADLHKAYISLEKQRKSGILSRAGYQRGGRRWSDACVSRVFLCVCQLAHVDLVTFSPSKKMTDTRMKWLVYMFGVFFCVFICSFLVFLYWNPAQVLTSVRESCGRWKLADCVWICIFEWVSSDRLLMMAFTFRATSAVHILMD